MGRGLRTRTEVPRRGERGRERRTGRGGRREQGKQGGGVFVRGHWLSGGLAGLWWMRHGAGGEREQLRRNAGD